MDDHRRGFNVLHLCYVDLVYDSNKKMDVSGSIGSQIVTTKTNRKKNNL